MKHLSAWLLTAGLVLTPISYAADSDYEVGGGGTWKRDEGLKTRKCETVCSSGYHGCMADCARGAVETMLLCTSSCRVNYCEVKCEDD